MIVADSLASMRGQSVAAVKRREHSLCNRRHVFSPRKLLRRESLTLQSWSEESEDPDQPVWPLRIFVATSALSPL